MRMARSSERGDNSVRTVDRLRESSGAVQAQVKRVEGKRRDELEYLETRVGKVEQVDV
jgi:hypothetical protein